MNLDVSLFENNWPQRHQNSKCRCPSYLLQRALTSPQWDDLDPIAVAALHSNRADKLLRGQNAALLDHTFNWFVKETQCLEKSANSAELVVGSFIPCAVHSCSRPLLTLPAWQVERRWTSPLRTPCRGADVRSCLCCGIRSWHETQI